METLLDGFAWQTKGVQGSNRTIPLDGMETLLSGAAARP